jgi:distribution and morphology protein 32
MVFKDLNYINRQIIKRSAIPTALITKEFLLSQTDSIWQRFAIRSKWALIKSYRPFNVDELSAIFSWVIISHILWIILGTTTFFSLLFFGLNSLFAKEIVAKTMGKIIMSCYPEFNIVFKDAVVPNWNDGMIDFKKVKVQTVNENGLQLDLSFDSIKLTLSFKKWKDLKGIVEDVKVHGLTGTIDRTHISPDTPEVDWFDNTEYEIESLKIKDSSITVIQQNAEPLKIAIFDMEIPKIRANWILLDLLNAANISGTVNDSLFTFHKRQHQLAYVNDIKDELNPWKRIMRHKLDPVDIESIGMISDQFNWLTGGKMDIIADFMPPADDGEPGDSKYLVADFKFQFYELTTKLPSEEPKLSTGEPIISIDELKPILTYFNSKRNDEDGLPPFSFRIVKRVDELENVSTLKESKLLDLIATEIYIEMLKTVKEFEVEQRNKRIMAWSQAVASQILVVGLGAMA